MVRVRGLIYVIISIATTPSIAHADKYHVTEGERAACSDDAARFCSESYPDEDKLLACMKVNRASLSANCLVAFDGGIKRRHL